MYLNLDSDMQVAHLKDSIVWERSYREDMNWLQQSRLHTSIVVGSSSGKLFCCEDVIPASLRVRSYFEPKTSPSDSKTPHGPRSDLKSSLIVLWCETQSRACLTSQGCFEISYPEQMFSDTVGLQKLCLIVSLPYFTVDYRLRLLCLFAGLIGELLCNDSLPRLRPRGTAGSADSSSFPTSCCPLRGPCVCENNVSGTTEA